MSLRPSDPEKRRELQRKYDAQKREAARRYRQRQIEKARKERAGGWDRPEQEKFFRAKRELKRAKRAARKKTNKRDVYGPVFSGLCRFARRQGCYAATLEETGDCTGETEAHHVVPRARLAGDWLYWMAKHGRWAHQVLPGLDTDLSGYPRQGNVVGLCTGHHTKHHSGQMHRIVDGWGELLTERARRLGEWYDA